MITYDPKKALWLHVLQGRLNHHPQIVFLPLALGDKFFGLLRASTLLLDPFPFGGGVTTLEAFSVCRLCCNSPGLSRASSRSRRLSTGGSGRGRADRR